MPKLQPKPSLKIITFGKVLSGSSCKRRVYSSQATRMLHDFRLSRRQTILVAKPTDSRMNQHQGNSIEILLEWLELLRITKEDASDRTTDEILIALAPVVHNKQAVISHA